MDQKKILIVEDESIVAKDIEHSLEALGYQVRGIAGCGEEAINKARETMPDLILMDIMLKGGMDGVQTVQEVHRIMDVPVVYLTACADKKTLERAKATQPFGYILKPFEERELQTAVDMAIFRHQMERQLKENKEWFEGTLQCIGHGVVVTDPQGAVTLINPIAEHLTGWSKQDAIGRPFSMIFRLSDERTREEISDPMHFSSGCPTFLTAKDGREIPIVLKVTPNHEGPHATGLIMSFLDITDRKKLEQLKDDFVSTVSHELRTPMMIIRESLSQVLDGLHGDVNEKQKNFLSLSLRGIDRLSRIINDLLDMAKIEAGEVEFKREKVDFKRLAHEAAASFAGMAKNKGIEIKENFPKGKTWAYVHKDKMTQVFTNLLGNAFKFTEKGSVEVLLSCGQGSIECRIKDTGKGIARENVAKVFGKFQQFDRQNGPGEKGTGLGLAISKGIIEMHNGKIDVESELEKGTTFKFSFPQKNTNEVLKECLKHEVKNATKQRMPLSMLRFQIKSASGKLSKRKEAFILHRLERFAKKSLRRKSDFVMKDENNIYMMLLGMAEQDGRNVTQRLWDSMLAHLKERRLSGLVSVEAKVTTFNPDKNTSEEFFQKAHALLDLKAQEDKKTEIKNRILLVDDERDTIELLASRLSASGFRVRTAGDGVAAINAVKDEAPDLIILDWMMPEMDGLEACRKLKDEPAFAKIPVILFTAKAQKADEEAAAEAGADAYVVKPVEAKTLLETIQKLLN